MSRKGSNPPQPPGRRPSPPPNPPRVERDADGSLVLRGKRMTIPQCGQLSAAVTEQLHRLEAQQAALSSKLDILLSVLAGEQDDQEEQHHTVTLDGETIAAGDRDRDQTQSLG